MPEHGLGRCVGHHKLVDCVEPDRGVLKGQSPGRASLGRPRWCKICKRRPYSFGRSPTERRLESPGVANSGALYFAVTLERRSSFFDLSPQQGNYERRCERDCDDCESQHIEHGYLPWLSPEEQLADARPEPL
jgi:hypothetical protein